MVSFAAAGTHATACSVDQDTPAQILTVAYRPSVQLKVIAGVVNIG